VEQSWFDTWISNWSVLGVGGILAVALVLAALGGAIFRTIHDRRSEPSHSETQEGYIVSAVLGLMALLLGFTFALAVDRYEIRRHLVLDSANAIGAAYLQTQLLDEPHRSRISNILERYVDNVIALARASPGRTAPLLAIDDQLVTELWQGTAAGFDSIRQLDFSSAYVASISRVIDFDEARREARETHVPTEVFAILFIYFIVTAAVIGYVLTCTGGRLSAGCLLVLMLMSLLIILDIDRPTVGGVRETRAPMVALQKNMARWEPEVFERWRNHARQEPETR
jgi:hypothetical protein